MDWACPYLRHVESNGSSGSLVCKTITGTLVLFVKDGMLIMYKNFFELRYEQQNNVAKALIEHNKLLYSLNDLRECLREQSYVRVDYKNMNVLGCKLVSDTNLLYLSQHYNKLPSSIRDRLTAYDSGLLEKGFTLRLGGSRGDFIQENKKLLLHFKDHKLISVVRSNNEKGLSFTQRFGFKKMFETEVDSNKDSYNTNDYSLVFFHKEIK